MTYETGIKRKRQCLLMKLILFFCVCVWLPWVLVVCKGFSVVGASLAAELRLLTAGASLVEQQALRHVSFGSGGAQA